MDDVPLTDAIRNLARQAGINYMLDPKIGYGQVGPDGKAPRSPTSPFAGRTSPPSRPSPPCSTTTPSKWSRTPRARSPASPSKTRPRRRPLVTKIIQLKYASPSNVVASVQAIFDGPNAAKSCPMSAPASWSSWPPKRKWSPWTSWSQRLDTQTKQVLIEARDPETTINPNDKERRGLDRHPGSQRVTRRQQCLRHAPTSRPRRLNRSTSNPPGAISSFPDKTCCPHTRQRRQLLQSRHRLPRTPTASAPPCPSSTLTPNAGKSPLRAPSRWTTKRPTSRSATSIPSSISPPAPPTPPAVRRSLTQT